MKLTSVDSSQKSTNKGESGDMYPFAPGRNTKTFFQKETQEFMSSNNCSDLDRDAVKRLITVSGGGGFS